MLCALVYSLFGIQWCSRLKNFYSASLGSNQLFGGKCEFLLRFLIGAWDNLENISSRLRFESRVSFFLYKKCSLLENRKRADPLGLQKHLMVALLPDDILLRFICR